DWPEYICDLLYEGEGDFDVDAAVEEAARLAKAIGRLPGELEEFLGGPFSPRMAWRELLWRYVARYLPSDYSWRRPSKRLRAQGIYLPRVVRDEELRLCVAVDVSGSVSEGELRDFLSEVSGICGSFQQVRGKLITCDCSVQDVFELDENFRLDRIRIRGRGGTSTVPVFEYIRQNVPDCRLLVYLTDGETGEEGMPREPPPYPVIWVIPSDGTDRYIRFGEVLRMG
ncbi:MAG: VWA-like domain-containing protein, partial [Candidatus Hadarchaeales archaeon]